MPGTRFNLRHLSPNLSLLQLPQKCSDMDVMNPTLPANPGTLYPLAVSLGSSPILSTPGCALLTSVSI